MRTSVMGGKQSLIWSIERMLLTVSSADDDTKLGMTRPGQSHSIRASSMNSVCKYITIAWNVSTNYTCNMKAVIILNTKS
jgi:hypothetical protein